MVIDMPKNVILFSNVVPTVIMQFVSISWVLCPFTEQYFTSYLLNIIPYILLHEECVNLVSLGNSTCIMASRVILESISSLLCKIVLDSKPALSNTSSDSFPRVTHYPQMLFSWVLGH